MNHLAASPPAELRPLIRALLGYLAAHPQAKDSIDGVQGWWLSGGLDWSRRQVEATLDYLVEEDLLEKRDYGGREIFFLPEERGSALAAYLDELTCTAGLSSERRDV